MNAWLMGLIVVAIALISLWVPRFRVFNSVAAIWIVLSVFLLPAMMAERVSLDTRWNNLVVGILIGVFSLSGRLTPASTI